MPVQHRTRGLLIILLAATGLLLAAASTQPVGLGQSAASITVSPGQGPPGTHATVAGSGFPSMNSGKILWDSSSGAQIGSFSTNANGAFSTSVEFPSNAAPGGHVIWACTIPKQLKAGPVCASRSVKVTEPATKVPTRVPVTVVPPTPVRTACDVRHIAGEVVIDFETFAADQNLRGVTLPEGVRFVGDIDLRVFSPSVATHSGSKALRTDYAGEFGSAGAMMRISFTNLQDFVGMYVGLNERIWAASPITAVLTAYSLDASGHRVVAGTDSVSFGPAATPIRKCLSVMAPGIVEVTLNYDAGEPEAIDDLVLRGPATPVPLPGDDQSPRITILLPEAGATFTSPYVRLQGEVREDRELASMNFQLRAGSFHDLAFTPAGVTPEGDRLYLFALDPLPASELTECGENTVQVRAYDTSGNIGGADQTFRLMAGDLSVIGAEPVQVVYGADLVREKGTAFRVKVRSTFACPVETQFLLDLPEDEWSSGPVGSGDYHIGLPPGYEYPDTWGPVTIPAGAEDFAVMLPYVPEGQETEGFGDAVAAGLVRTLDNVNPDVRVLPRPVAEEVRFAVEIDPQNSLPEQDETNNRFDSPPLRVVTTRPYRFIAFLTHSAEGGRLTCSPTMAQVRAAVKPAVEYVLGVFPIADEKISVEVSPREQTWDFSAEERGTFLARIESLAKTYGLDFAVAMMCAGGGTSMGDAAFVGVTWPMETLAHEYNHVVVPMWDVYSKDCYCNWGESYCEVPGGDRFYCCYDQNDSGTEDWTSKRATEEAMGVDPMQGCTVDCGLSEIAGCDGVCCMKRCATPCAAARGIRYGCPDQRPTEERTLFASDGFWPNRWLREEGKLYFMDGPSGDNWIIRESMQALGEPSCWDTLGVGVNGYVDLLQNPRFRNDDDPAALLVSGSITKDGQATLLPFVVLPEAFLDREPGSTGNYTFVLKDASGYVLSRTGFDLVFWQSGPNGGPLNEAQFVLRIEWVEGTSRIELLDQTGSLLASREVTPGVPVVEIANPAGGSVTAAKSVTIRWTASDPDGDDLTYSLAVSDDGGETWLPIAGGLEKDSYSLPVSAFAEGTTYLVKVLATDGVNTGSAVSAAPFSVVVGTPKTTLYAMMAGLVALAVAGALLIVLGLWPKKGRRTG
jgi:hypothetical protein